jgi:hypothetical protein
MKKPEEREGIMRNLDLRLSIVLAALAPLPAFAQVPVAPVDLPKVIFCSGQCFAVDDRGVRTPVNKGTLLREGQRLETGPGAYAQLKLGPAAEIALSERGQVRFDQKSVGGRDLVILDQGRLRMIGGDAMGKIATRLLELRTSDGTFSLKGADVEVKKLGTTIAPTLMKVNAGNASLRGAQRDVVISKDVVQGVAGGKVVEGRTFSASDVADRRNPVANQKAPIAPLPSAPLPPQASVPPSDLRGPIGIPMPPIAYAPVDPRLTVKAPDIYVPPINRAYTKNPSAFDQDLTLSSVSVASSGTVKTTSLSSTSTLLLAPTTSTLTTSLSGSTLSTSSLSTTSLSTTSTSTSGSTLSTGTLSTTTSGSTSTTSVLLISCCTTLLK